MLLHHYLEQIRDIHNEATAKIKNVLSEITDPKMRAAAEEWEPGDPIPHEHAQMPQKKADPSTAGAGDIPQGPAKPAAPETNQMSAHAGAPVHQPDQGTEQHEPAGGNAPA